jgi:sulfate adenylyltransferase
MTLKLDLPPPHGGRLVERVVRDRHVAEKLTAGCVSYDIEPTYDDGAPIRNVFREIMSTCYGFFSPVEGSMTRNEVERVLKERRLLNGWVFPFPLVFDISEDDSKRLGVGEGDRLLLKLKGQPFAILDIEEVYRIDSKDLATRTFGTPETVPGIVKRQFDKKHPGYNIYLNTQPMVLAGKYTIVNEPTLKAPFDRFWLPPAKCREEFKKRGWRTVIVHQTRNVPHLGHEFLMKNAAYMGDIEPANGILVNAIVGAKRIGDYPDEAIVEAHEVLHIADYIKPVRHLVTITLWDMRYGNPLESLLHGIVRQNLGCTHHMFGRDHASTGDYYDSYATQILWDKGIPSYGFEAPPYDVDNGVKIRPQNMGEFWYCPKCAEIAYNGNCNHADVVQRFSGSFIRSMISEGLSPPSVIMRPEVYKVVVKWWKTLGYPFNSKAYLLTKEKELEVQLPHMELPKK